MSDGGLAMPETYPQVTGTELAAWRGLSYPELAFEIIRRYADDIPPADLKRIIARTYTAAAFRSDEITPVRQLQPGVHILGLSNGPTLAFKDIAMQLLGNLFEYALAKSGQELNILGATSGDTGSAAEYAMRGKRGIRVFMLSPHRKMSPFQTAQMYSLGDANLFNLAVRGVFDDCQDIVKAVSADQVKRLATLPSKPQLLAQLVLGGARIVEGTALRDPDAPGAGPVLAARLARGSQLERAYRHAGGDVVAGPVGTAIAAEVVAALGRPAGRRRRAGCDRPIVRGPRDLDGPDALGPVAAGRVVHREGEDRARGIAEVLDSRLHEGRRGQPGDRLGWLGRSDNPDRSEQDNDTESGQERPSITRGDDASGVTGATGRPDRSHWSPSQPGSHPGALRNNAAIGAPGHGAAIGRAWQS